MRCSHCYVEAREGRELEPDEVNDILIQFDDFMARFGYRGKVYFTGGEPFLVEGLLDHVALAASKSMIPMVLTNGTMVDANRAVALRDAGGEIVQVSIEGMRKTHDGIRGDGTFDLATRALDACHHAGLETVVMMTLSKQTSSDVPRVIEHCLAHGVTRFSTGRLVPVGHGVSMVGHVLSPRELEATFRSITRMKKACKGKMDISIHDPLWIDACSGLNAGCSVARSGLCIVENGDIMPCRRLDFSIGNIRDMTMRDAWYSSQMNGFRMIDRFKGRCGKCKRRSWCGGCRAVARAITGDMLASDPQCFR